MSKPTSSTKTRVISAVVLILIFGLIYFLFRNEGFFWAGGLLLAIGSYEFSIMHLQADYNRLPRRLFVIISIINLLVALELPNYSLNIFLFTLIIYFVTVLAHAQKEQDLDHSWKFITSASMGVIYTSFFPSFALRLLHLPSGLAWFFFLLSAVFAGDIFAYFVGRKFGKRKLFELVSPKKTAAGTFGGLCGSLLVAIAFSFALNTVPIGYLIMTALLTGILGQLGDLFESLIKRVALVKDSGTLIPGHGGVLDRLDGVYFSAPIFYLIASTLCQFYLSKQ